MADGLPLLVLLDLVYRRAVPAEVVLEFTSYLGVSVLEAPVALHRGSDVRFGHAFFKSEVDGSWCHRSSDGYCHRVGRLLIFQEASGVDHPLILQRLLVLQVIVGHALDRAADLLVVGFRTVLLNRCHFWFMTLLPSLTTRGHFGFCLD